MAGVIAAGALLLTALPATAEDLFHDPVLYGQLTAPKAFDGLYAGVSFGLMNSNQKVFYSNANGYRVPAGVYAGYNAQINPWLIAGVEGQLEAAYEWQAGTLGYNAFVLGRLGLLTSDNFAVYEVAGLGLIDGNSAYALGVQAEQKLSETFSIRAESLSFGQLSPPAGIINYRGIMGMKLMLGGTWYLDGTSKSFTEPSPFSATPTRFSGPYLGLYAGGGYNPQHNFFGGDDFYGWHITRFFQGGIAGWNYDLGSMFRAGGEIQAGVNYNTSGQFGTDAQALARVGVVPFDGLMVYASGGVGMIEAVPAYSLGGGVEYALWGRNTLRFDTQVLGQIEPGPPFNVSGFSAVKATFGTLWHFD
jgi:hypothetical protein